MTLQGVWVVVIVLLCALHAAWRLSGAAARRRVARWLARAPMPEAWAQRLRRVDDASACGCDSCDRAAPAAPTTPATVRVVRLHRRQR
jgi:hypothetical protein